MASPPGSARPRCQAASRRPWADRPRRRHGRAAHATGRGARIAGWLARLPHPGCRAAGRGRHAARYRRRATIPRGLACHASCWWRSPAARSAMAGRSRHWNRVRRTSPAGQARHCRSASRDSHRAACRDPRRSPPRGGDGIRRRAAASGRPPGSAYRHRASPSRHPARTRCARGPSHGRCARRRHGPSPSATPRGTARSPHRRGGPARRSSGPNSAHVCSTGRAARRSIHLRAAPPCATRPGCHRHGCRPRGR